ncbi:MAG: hypothetical protein RLZZ505_3333 [Verrucomicrobiota bacterium]|jgi:SpoVK/Ycf46/Vps4 family AAA+-type ATPase
MPIHRRFDRAGTPISISSQSRLFELWVLRAYRDWRRKLIFHRINKDQFADDEVAEFLRLPHQEELPASTDGAVKKGDPRYGTFVIGKMSDRLAELEAGITDCCLAPMVAKNISLIASILGLSSTEARILEFFICLERVVVIRAIARNFVLNLMEELPEFLCRVLCLSQKQIEKALSPDSRLFADAILVWPEMAHCGKIGYPQFFSNEIAKATFAMELNDQAIIREVLTIVPASSLTLEDYPHASANIGLLIPYLKRCLATKRKGVNIYLYGSPGTGKTELARLLCKHSGAHGYEAKTTDENGNPLENRIGGLRAGAAFLGAGKNMLIFDEAEDVFSASSMTSGSKAGANKAWFNRFLETNRIPIIWISNNISDLDPAFTRRFDFVFEVPVPPRKHREKTIVKILGEGFDTGIVRRLALSEELSPAVVARARSVARTLSGKGMESNVSILISNTLKAQGHTDPLSRSFEPIDHSLYDMSYLNSSADLAEVVEGFRRHPSGRVCLHGAPGTGKTAFGHFLAEQLSIPLHIKKASDLLSPFLGVTEQKMSGAFVEAREEGAILLIDEVDSYLRDRTLAQPSWEVSQTNEFLTQLESYQGIFLATTNLRENLDPACLRRFDLKLHFGALEPSQARRLLLAHCAKLGIPAPDKAAEAMLAETFGLTPGDFANVTRQARFRKIRDARDYIERLTAEVSMKSGITRTIGFRV